MFVIQTFWRWAYM